MAFELPPLPYAMDALAPHISQETLEYHYGKHHQTYVTNLNKLTEGTPDADKSLEDVIAGAEGPLFNNAAQVWNHTFYWNCMAPGGGGEPGGDLGEKINSAFGSYAEFRLGMLAEPLSLYPCRHLIQAALESWSLPDLVDSARVIVNELTNATLLINGTAYNSIGGLIVLADGTERVQALVQQTDQARAYSTSFKVFDDCDPVWTPSFGGAARPTTP